MNDSLPTSGGPAPSGVSRRTVVKGAAWAVPVVTLAGAAPAFAGASQCVPEPVLVGGTCKRAGSNQDYRLLFGITGNDCTLGACNLAITQIREATGLTRPLYGAASDGTPIYICNTSNMASKVEVYGTITCDSTTYQGPETGEFGNFWLVDTPNLNSNNNECETFDGCSPEVAEQSTLQSTEETAPEAVQKSAPLDAPAEAPAAPAETEVVEPVIEAPATEAVAPPAEETVTP